ncbi:hypothetical protein [Pseudomonas matsuisoli]|uniref:Uncharacterized protein n=1 Tax=Pseudomonas matsuisoli TaxID=1515666 RepID=A0A917PXW9_9PSED|nr:hypothetical protein [Pseudomonas matsuisoli]GGJ98426.1 hypothetical protein GCM10009304_25410 [Pseudomonas matsuisoli]
MFKTLILLVPIAGTILVGWFICTRMTLELSRNRRVRAREWARRLFDASLIAALVGLPISFSMMIVLNSGF